IFPYCSNLFFRIIRHTPRTTLFPYTTLFRSTISGQSNGGKKTATLDGGRHGRVLYVANGVTVTLNTLTITGGSAFYGGGIYNGGDRKSTRLNSSHLGISYAVFCLKKKTTTQE